MKKIHQLLCLFYLDPPEYLTVGQGSAYTSKEMRKSAEAFDIHLDEKLIEIPCAIETMERYHAPLRLANE